ncbi:hypothetical protein MKW92_014204 [Papaver armeniacum]|nr:hypothetical protein MKW92_014204 [Papaver armeniacum]
MWNFDFYQHSCINFEMSWLCANIQGIALGCNFTEVSTFNGDRKDATFGIHKWKLVGTITRYFLGILSKFPIHPIVKDLRSCRIWWRNLRREI